MKRILTIALLVAAVEAMGQYNSTYQTNIVFQNQPRGFLTNLPPRPLNVTGSYYLSEDFNPADIYMRDSTKVEDAYVRFDLKDQLIEIKNAQTVKVLPFNKLLMVEVKAPSGLQQYINGGTINPALKDLLLQVRQDQGEVKLFAKFHTEYKKGNTNQNPMLNSGSSEDQILIKKTFIIARNGDFADAGQGKTTFRQDMIKIFGSDIAPLLKKANPRKEDDLIKLIADINRQLSENSK